MIGNIKKVGNDILFHAITKANVHDVIALLQEDEVDVNCKNINGQTPLHVSYTDLAHFDVVCGESGKLDHH